MGSILQCQGYNVDIYLCSYYQTDGEEDDCQDDAERWIVILNGGSAVGAALPGNIISLFYSSSHYWRSASNKMKYLDDPADSPDEVFVLVRELVPALAAPPVHHVPRLTSLHLAAQ